MPKAVDEYFDHMEKVVLGTKHIPLEYENQFGRHPGGWQGRGHACPFCGIGFKGKSKGVIKCPDCGKEWKINA